MKNKLRLFRLSALLAVISVVTACVFNDNDDQTSVEPSAVQASEVSNEVARENLAAASGGTVSIGSAAAGLAGGKVEIPADAALDDIQVQVGFEDALPGPFSAAAISAQATQVSRTVVLKVANGGPSTFVKPITVTIPYDAAAAGDLPPVVLYWDETALRYKATSVVGVNRTAATVSFRTSHFSKFVAVVAKILAVAPPSYDTQFRIGTDSILHQNFGSYRDSGHCAAFASMSTHYFGLKKGTKLYNFAQEGSPEQPADDEVTRTALTLTYALIVQKWGSVASSIVVPSAADTGLLMVAAMLITGDPLHLVMHSNDPNIGGHSVTAYAYDAVKKHFRIYDSNYPKDDISFAWDKTTGFGAYSKAALYPADLFKYIGYASDDTFGAPAQFQKIVDDWVGGKLKDFYANLSITDHKSVAQGLTYGKAVATQVAYADNQTVSGAFVRPAGSSKPVYLHTYYDGVRQAVVAPALAADGKFSLNFSTKLEKRVEVMLIVSEHAKAIEIGFSGFGKFAVQPEGKNFFVNFGFETGDITGWSAQTTLLNNGNTFAPTKVAVVGVGFDPIATDIPTSVFGSHALQVNDSTPSYHTTFASQRATVPATGNPQLRFQWAAVLEDPQHDPGDQPYIEVVVRNVTKSTDLYRKRFYTNDPLFTGWKDYRNGNWKAIPWQVVPITGLASAAGDTIELSIVGADCGLGGHGGYVYLDGEE